MDDSNRNPTGRQVRYWRDQKQKSYGPRSGPLLWSALAEHADQLEEKRAVIRYLPDKGVILLLTPVMIRAHSLQSAGDIIFVDSTGSCDAGENSVTFIVTLDPVGAIPLAVLITEAKTDSAYSSAFKLLKETLATVANGGFSGVGTPKYIMTDKDEAERNGLRSVFPQATMLLCSFHVAQAVWRWLWSTENGIAYEHKQKLMAQFQKIMYSLGKVDLAVAYQGLKADAVEALSKIFELQNFVLLHVKSYNAVKLIHDIVNNMSGFYEMKLSDFARGEIRTPQALLRHLLGASVSADATDRVVRDPHSGFSVSSDQDPNHSYYVHPSGLCSCPQGFTGRFCKHMALVFRKHPEILFPNLPQVRPEHRRLACYLASGVWREDLEYFRSCSSFEPLRTQQETAPAAQEPLILGPTSTDVEEQLVGPEEQPCSSSAADMADSMVAVASAERLKAKVSDIVDQFGTEPQSLPFVQKLASRLGRVKTVGQFLAFGHSVCAATKMHKSGAKIWVQPNLRRVFSTSRSRLSQARGRPTERAAAMRAPPPQTLRSDLC